MPETPVTPGSVEWLDVQLADAEAMLEQMKGVLTMSPLYQAILKQEGEVAALRRVRDALKPAETPR